LEQRGVKQGRGITTSVIKEGTKLMGHVACKGRKNWYKMWVRNPDRRGHLKCLGVNGSATLSQKIKEM